VAGSNKRCLNLRQCGREELNVDPDFDFGPGDNSQAVLLRLSPGLQGTADRPQKRGNYHPPSDAERAETISKVAFSSIGTDDVQ
jgi:hypothetical protein